MRKAVLILAVLALVVALAILATRLVDVPEVTPEPVFDGPVSISIGTSHEFGDGLLVSVLEVQDSRCPEDVQCVWAGELTAELRAERGPYPEPVFFSLGTLRSPSYEDGFYRYTLIDGDGSSLVLLVAPSS